jgi:phosphofructokinase-like protein
MKIAILTGGGDCSGLNAAIRAVVRSASKGDRVYGIREGWKGLLEGHSFLLTHDKMSGILPMGGTILGSSRVNPLKVRGGIKRSLAYFKRQKFDALIAIGGEGTLRVAHAFSQAGMPIVCIPKTIDNDTWGTDYTIGFHTAVQIATEAIDRLHTTAESHRRVMIVEVMGRHAGWIATYAGIAGGADAILIPEEPFPIQELLRIIRTRAKRKRYFSIFVVSEDARIQLEGKKILRTPLQHDEYGDIKLGGIGELLARELRRRTDSEVRVTVLGHIQRGGTPVAYDRVLATRLGVFALQLVKEKRFGLMAALQGNQIRTISIEETAQKLKLVDPEISRVARRLFG